MSLPALDVRRRADHRSEMRTQLLMGEVVRRLAISPDGRWWKVESLTDGYGGWARTWGLIEASAGRVEAWRRRARGRVVAAHAEVRVGRSSGALVSPLFWSGRLIAGPVRNGYRRVELPDGRSGWVRSTAIDVGSRRGSTLIERVRGLLGVPYLWGGRTPMGIDCSAFTQLVLLEQDVTLPRDAVQQFRIGTAVGIGEPAREGDLVFFGPGRGPVGHVGLVLGGGYYAHARGRVRINSLVPGNPLWDKELAEQFRGVRRPV